ncbi:MAG TPA: hypothetical protein VEV83_16230 [Parafilimonas sp.]|nr:hypothetical protein [Parafilimonas sp.]
MKTKILLRSLLILAAWFVSANNGTFAESSLHSSTSNSLMKQEPGQTPGKDQPHQHEDRFYIAQPSDDHEIDTFNSKHHEKRSFWKSIANKLFVMLYDLIVLSPIAAEVLKELLHHV